nr:prepilin-type N-terminal cleavage/methylation domain-containing protein [Desulfobacterales bacterium]
MYRPNASFVKCQDKDPKKGPLHNGFTLLELLISFVIFVTILSIIYAVYKGTFRVIDECETRAEIFGMARLSLERIAEDLESTYVPKDTRNSKSDLSRWFWFIGEKKGLEGLNFPSLRFVSLSHLTFDEREIPLELAEIRYYVRKDKEKDGYILFRSDRPLLYNKRGEGDTDGTPLCDRLKDVEFQYYDARGEVHDSWYSTKEPTMQRIPRVVSVELTFLNNSDAKKPFKFSTKVVLPAIRARDERGGLLPG